MQDREEKDYGWEMGEEGGGVFGGGMGDGGLYGVVEIQIYGYMDRERYIASGQIIRYVYSQ